ELRTYLNAPLARRYTKPTGSFVTAFYAVFDPLNGALSYASAGHSPPRLLRCADGCRLALNRAQKLPLGIKPDEGYAEQTVSRVPGDQVVFVTDGVTGAVNADGDVCGPDRIGQALTTCPPSASELLDAILEDWIAFTTDIPATDDRTLVVVKRT